MNTTQTQSLIIDTLTTFGNSVLVILTAVIGIGVAYLVFRFGWRKVKMSLDTAPRGVNAYFTNKRYGITSDGKRYDTWGS
jgi:hypothetical protein